MKLSIKSCFSLPLLLHGACVSIPHFPVCVKHPRTVASRPFHFLFLDYERLSRGWKPTLYEYLKRAKKKAEACKSLSLFREMGYKN